MENNFKFRLWDNKDYMSVEFTLEDMYRGNIVFTRDCVQMLYSDVNDKFGKNICQGDIVKIFTFSSFDKGVEVFISEVKYVDGAFVVSTSDEDDTYLGAYAQSSRPIVEFEIIGNIYQQNYLLKK